MLVKSCYLKDLRQFSPATILIQAKRVHVTLFLRSNVMSMKEFGRLGLIRHYFGTGKHGHKCTIDELKALSAADKKEFGDRVVEATGARKNTEGRYVLEVV